MTTIFIYTIMTIIARGDIMQIPSRFTIAIHILTGIEIFEEKPTSELLAKSIGINPVIVRTIIKDLREAGLLITQRGSAGAKLSKPLSEMSFYDVYKAVDMIKDNVLFRFHEDPSPNCEIGRNIHEAISGYLTESQIAMETVLKSISMQEAVRNIQELIKKEND